MKSKDILASLEHALDVVIIAADDLVIKLKAQSNDISSLDASANALIASCTQIDKSIADFMAKYEKWGKEAMTPQRFAACQKFKVLAKNADQASKKSKALIPFVTRYIAGLRKLQGFSIEQVCHDALLPLENQFTVMMLAIDQVVKALSAPQLDEDAVTKSLSVAKHTIELVDQAFTNEARLFATAKQKVGANNPVIVRLEALITQFLARFRQAKVRFAAVANTAYELIADYEVIHTEQPANN